MNDKVIFKDGHTEIINSELLGRLSYQNRIIIPEELTFKAASCGFECNNFDEVLAFAKYFNRIACGFEVNGLYIEPKGQLVPLKHSSEERDVWEYLMLEY